MTNNRDQARELKAELELKSEASIALQNGENINKVLQVLEGIKAAVADLSQRVGSLEGRSFEGEKDTQDFKEKTTKGK